MAELLVLSLAGALSGPDNWRSVFPLTRRMGSHFSTTGGLTSFHARRCRPRIDPNDRFGELTRQVSLDEKLTTMAASELVESLFVTSTNCRGQRCRLD
jgi:hypothetical protein